MRADLHTGWYQVAFERDLKDRITPVTLGPLPLVLIRDASGARVFDAVCPHRGAHLGYGGKLDGNAIVCGFHGHRIGLGEDAGCHLHVRGYRTLEAGGLIFVLLDESHENGFTGLMKELEATHFIVQGFTLRAKVPAELVVENGFDAAHFQSVHGLKNLPSLRLLPGCNGDLTVEAAFHTGSFDNAWHNNPEEPAGSRIGFQARVFSPNVCLTRLSAGEGEYLVISGSTPDGDGYSTIRVSVAAAPDPAGRPPSEQAIRALLRDSKLAYEQDMVIWEHRVHDAPSKLTQQDELVLAFHRFCEGFLETHSTK